MKKLVGIDAKTAVRMVAALLVVVWLSNAAAQFTVIGTVTGTLDGEERVWYALGYDGEDGSDSTARLSRFGVGVASYSTLDIQAHSEQRFVIAGTLSISGILNSLEGCPCVVSFPEVMYFSTSSMFESVYDTLDAEVVVEALELAADGTYRVTGTFRALLGFVEHVMRNEADPGQTIELSGTFAIERLPSEEE